MSGPTTLPVDHDQIAQFVGTLFRHADEGTYASMRTFLELEEGPPVDIRTIKLNGDPTALTKAMIERAQLAADYAKPCVFAPPVSTFSNAKQAREIDLANGLALSVEIDQDAARARQRLEFLIGPATAVVASGGTWTDPATGEIQDKLHLHWRLKEPTRTPEAHARLKQARTIATRLVGGDCTNKPVVHPIRMPGSWHRKAEPKLCQTIALNPDAEIDLHATLSILFDIQPEFRSSASGDRADPGEDRETAELIRRVVTGEEYHAALRDLAWRYLKGSMPPAQVVLTLRGLMDASTGPHDDRWQHRRDQIPMLVRTAQEKIDADKTKSGQSRIVNLADYGAERFTGQPPPIKWLVENSIPLGVLVLLASQGGVGKSYKVMELCCQVAIPQKDNLLSRPVLGGHVVDHGRAVFITSEDDEAEMHRRLASLDFLGLRHEHPGQLIPVALPNAGGPLPLFVATHNGVQTTPEWDMLCDQLASVPNLKLVGLDPLSTFAQAELDSDNSAAAFITGKLAALAAELGATVMVAHHMRKGSQAPKSLAEARENIRGASNLVDGVRTAYALWLPDNSEARRICADMRIPFEYGRVVKGAIVKTNRKANQSISTYIRTDDGLLLDRSSDLEAIRPLTQAGLEDALVEAVATQAEAKQPMNHFGENGLYKQNHRLPENLRDMPRAKLEAMAQKLLDSERLVKCVVPGSKAARVLDVPGGAYDIGDTEFAIGGVRAERKRGAP